MRGSEPSTIRSADHRPERPPSVRRALLPRLRTASCKSSPHGRGSRLDARAEVGTVTTVPARLRTDSCRTRSESSSHRRKEKNDTSRTSHQLAPTRGGVRQPSVQALGELTIRHDGAFGLDLPRTCASPAARARAPPSRSRRARNDGWGRLRVQRHLDAARRSQRARPRPRPHPRITRSDPCLRSPRGLLGSARRGEHRPAPRTPAVNEAARAFASARISYGTHPVARTAGPAEQHGSGSQTDVNVPVGDAGIGAVDRRNSSPCGAAALGPSSSESAAHTTAALRTSAPGRTRRPGP